MRRDVADSARGKGPVRERMMFMTVHWESAVREELDVTDSARGKCVGREGRDVTDNARGKLAVREGRDVTESARGKGSFGRHVMLQRVQGGNRWWCEK